MSDKVKFLMALVVERDLLEKENATLRAIAEAARAVVKCPDVMGLACTCKDDLYAALAALESK